MVPGRIGSAADAWAGDAKTLRPGPDSRDDVLRSLGLRARMLHNDLRRWPSAHERISHALRGLRQLPERQGDHARCQLPVSPTAWGNQPSQPPNRPLLRRDRGPGHRLGVRARGEQGRDPSLYGLYWEPQPWRQIRVNRCACPTSVRLTSDPPEATLSCNNVLWCAHSTVPG